MKGFIKLILQKTFGFRNYLFFFSLYSINRVNKKKYEKEFLHFIGLIPEKGIVLDIGANIGITAISIAKAKPKTEVHAYEPIEENFHTLKRVVKWFKLTNVKLNNSALGSSPGCLKMIMPLEGQVKMQGLSKVYTEGSKEKGVIYEVPVDILDNIYASRTDISAIKIDVENHEFEVLSNGKQTLINNKPIVYCELWKNQKRLMVVDLMKSLDYNVLIFDELKTSLSPVLDAANCDDNNFFFIPNK